MTGRRAIAVLLLGLLVGLAAPPAAAADPPGTIAEVSAGGSQPPWLAADVRGGLLLSFGDRIERWRPGDNQVLASGISVHLVASDPTTGDVVFSDPFDGRSRVRRLDATGRIATVATLAAHVTGLDVAPDGTIYTSRREGVDAISADGRVTPFAGGGTADPGSSGVPALTAHLEYVTSLTVEPDGDVLVFENVEVHRVSDGVIRRIAGTPNGYCSPPDPCGDLDPAAAARFTEITSADVGPDGSIYVAEHRAARVRAIRPDGRVVPVAGSWDKCLNVFPTMCAVAGPGPHAFLDPVQSIAVVGDDLYVSEAPEVSTSQRLSRVTDVTRMPVFAPEGYRLVAADGGVFTFGWSPFHGSTGDIRLVSPIVAGESNGAGGYWFVAGDGGVFPFGSAGFFGSAAGRTSSPVVDMAAAPDGRGYHLLERDGRVHSFGSAVHRGDASPTPTASLAAIVATRDGVGYRVVRTDGSQTDFQSTVGGSWGPLPRLNAPIVSAVTTASGQGMWLVAADGGVFTQGDAPFFGSTGAMRLNQPVLDLVPTPTERGYWLVAADGGVFSFGDARFLGSMGDVRLNRPVVAAVPGPQRSR